MQQSKVSVTTVKKTTSSAKSVISTYSILLAGGSEKGVWGERGRLFEFEWEGERWWGGGWRLLTFSAFRMGAYSRWALIRGWALIRINTVIANNTEYWSLWRHTTFWVVFSFLSTTTLFGSNMRTFMDSHLDDIHSGWVSGIKGVGGFITVQPAL